MKYVVPAAPGRVLGRSSSNIEVSVKTVLKLPLGLLAPSQAVHLGKARVKINILDPRFALQDLNSLFFNKLNVFDSIDTKEKEGVPIPITKLSS